MWLSGDFPMNQTRERSNKNEVPHIKNGWGGTLKKWHSEKSDIVFN